MRSSPGSVFFSVMAAAGAAGLLAGGCKQQGGSLVTDSRPATEPAGVAPPSGQDVPASRPASQPVTRPASRPEDDLPKSTFDTSPPYPVQLFVRKPEDKQPGWLKVLHLGDDGTMATVSGFFPEHNRIEIVTRNVRRLQLELGYLPLAERKRIVLHIDEQGIELTQRDRQFITLERRPTGEWKVEKPPKE